MSDKRYFWRLVEHKANPWEGTTHSTIPRVAEEAYQDNGYWASCGFVFHPHQAHDSWEGARDALLVRLNALLAADALDWSGLSKETCEALRGLGVEIPEEERCG